MALIDFGCAREFAPGFVGRLASLTRALNDYMPDATRQGLRPYLSRMVGTADDGLSVWRAWQSVAWAERRVYPLVWYSPMAWARVSAARRLVARGEYLAAVQACAQVMYRAGLVRSANWELVWPLLDRLLPLTELHESHPERPTKHRDEPAPVP